MPYDGGNIGDFSGDAIRNLTGMITRFLSGIFHSSAGSSEPTGVFTRGYDSGNGHPVVPNSSATANYVRIEMDASRVVPTATENRPAAMAYLACITY